jgi:hypothetical protein
MELPWCGGSGPWWVVRMSQVQIPLSAWYFGLVSLPQLLYLTQLLKGYLAGRDLFV